MTIQDRRVRKTQNALASALITLTLEKEYDTITIRDITERADVGYATFFRHYPDKEALLHDVLEVVLNELMDLLACLTGEADPAALGTLLFRYVEDHSELICVFLNTHSSSLMKRIMEAGTQGTLDKRRPLEESLVPAAIAAHHIVASSIALIQWWLDNEMPYPPERMGIIYRTLIIQPTRQVAFQSEPTT